MAISGERLEDIVQLEMRAEFEAEKKQWLAWNKWSNRNPGLFKLECEGRCMIALCSNCYLVEEDGGKNKLSTKGMSKAQNAVTDMYLSHDSLGCWLVASLICLNVTERCRQESYMVKIGLCGCVMQLRVMYG